MPLGHIKGQARLSTFLFQCSMVWYKSQDNPELKLKNIFPKLADTGARIYFTLEHHTSMSEIALRNAVLSQRGSIRKAHCAVGWVGT